MKLIFEIEIVDESHCSIKCPQLKKSIKIKSETTGGKNFQLYDCKMCSRSLYPDLKNTPENILEQDYLRRDELCLRGEIKN